MARAERIYHEVRAAMVISPPVPVRHMRAIPLTTFKGHAERTGDAMSAGSGVRGAYAKSAQVRERIVHAATEEFAESGFRAGTMKKIAERAGISQRGLVHHFASKEDLLLEVLEARAAESAALMRDGEPKQVLRSVVDVMVDNARRPGLVELHTVLFAEATSSEHPAHAHHAKRLRLWRDYLTSVFAALDAEGALAPGLDPEVVATTLVAVQDGVQLQWLYDPGTIDMAGAVDSYLASVVPGWDVRDRSAPHSALLKPPAAS